MRTLLFSLVFATAQLSFSEAFPHPQSSGAFNVLDTNADGSLSRGEVAAIVR